MRRTAGIKNKMRTRVERREKGSDRLPTVCETARAWACGGLRVGSSDKVCYTL